MLFILLVGLLMVAEAFADGPYPAVSGISAAADDAAVAGTNPAAMTLFDERIGRIELLGFASESTWEGSVDGNGTTTVIEDSSATAVPVGAMVLPFRDGWWFGFTILGSGFGEEYDDDWVGRYFLQEYELLYISAYPSVATRLTDRLSVAGSLALTYTTYDQRKAVPNVDPGFGDAALSVDTDGFSVGVGLSALYEFSEHTRLGFNYRSEIEPSLTGSAEFSDLGPITESLLDRAGLLNARIDVVSRQPQSITLGAYHDLENGHTITADVAWIEFSEFKLAEVFVNGDQIVENEQSYDDTVAFAGSYSWPVSDRWRIGIGGFFVTDAVGDENRNMTLRLDDIWSVGIGFKWRWKDNRTINASLNYLAIGDAPVRTPELPGLGQVTGRFTQRDTVYIRMALSFGKGPGIR